MTLQLFQSCTASVLQTYGFVSPRNPEGWFQPPSEKSAAALFFAPDQPDWGCSPPFADPNVCVFYSPTGFRFGIERCHNKDDLLVFWSKTFGPQRASGEAHLFASPGSQGWYYLGQSVIGSGRGTNGVLIELDIGLSTKLPRWLWYEAGGYRGWLICMYPYQFVVQGASDADRVLWKHWGADSRYMEITRYEGDCLSAYTDMTGASVLMYDGPPKSLHSLGTQHQYSEEDYLGDGNFEFPRRWAIPRQQAIDLIRHYLDTGRRLGLVDD